MFSICFFFLFFFQPSFYLIHLFLSATVRCYQVESISIRVVLNEIIFHFYISFVFCRSLCSILPFTIEYKVGFDSENETKQKQQLFKN